MKKRFIVLIALFALTFNSCKTNSTTPGQYNGKITKQQPCAQGCK